MINIESLSIKALYFNVASIEIRYRLSSKFVQTLKIIKIERIDKIKCGLRETFITKVLFFPSYIHMHVYQLKCFTLEDASVTQIFGCPHVFVYGWIYSFMAFSYKLVKKESYTERNTFGNRGIKIKVCFKGHVSWQ